MGLGGGGCGSLGRVDRRRRGHIGREARGQGGQQRLALRVTGVRAEQRGTNRVLMNQRDRLRDAQLSQQAGLHFFGFNPEATDLDLLIEPAQIFQRRMLGQPTDAVAAAVQARAVAIGLRHEALGGQSWSAQVTPSQADATQAQLARHTWRAQLKLVIEHMAEHVGQRPANR
ncbi:hypothetical protein PS623_04363 [Pseudomonas fluorescens]|nr:hypothetical protein PS623_04363 [Pseudomonas fluorescens]